MKKLLLTVTYANSEGKKVKLKDCDVLTNYGDIIYFWNGDKVNKTYVLNVYTMTMREVEYSKGNEILTVLEFTLKAKER